MIPIASRWSPRRRAVVPATSMQPRHRPQALDRHERSHAEARRAARSTRSADARTPRARRPLRAERSTHAGFGVSGTRHQISSATDAGQRRPAPRRSRASTRSAARTRAAPSPPARRTPPATMIQPPSDACRSGGYHVRDRLQRRHQARGDAGADQRARDEQLRSAVGQREQRAPRPPRPRAAPARRGAGRSGRAGCPPGICIAANARK